MQKPVKSKTTHQDTDESMVLGILSAVILFLTILTIGSYADTQSTLSEQNLISENSIQIEEEQRHMPYIINISNSPNIITSEETLNM